MELEGGHIVFFIIAVVLLFIFLRLRAKRGAVNRSPDGGEWVGAERYPPGNGKRYSYYRNAEDKTIQVESRNGRIEEVTVSHAPMRQTRDAVHGKGVNIWDQLK